MDYTLKIVPEKNRCRYLLCDQNENYYVLNRTTYELLQSLREHGDFTAVAAQMKYIHPEIDTTPCSVQKCVESVTTALSNNKRNKYVRPIATIVKPNRGEVIYKPLSLFFHRRVFLFLFAIGLFTTIAFLLVKSKYYSFSGASINQLPVYYILFLFLLFIHELGHAAAAYAYGIKPKEIAFGIYFIFPVLYTNVSGIWELNTYKRTVVNLAGIYFQLLANIGLIALILLDILPSVVMGIFFLNSISIMISLIPFFRYDGYWIFSDLAGITNLCKKSNNMLVRMIVTPRMKINSLNVALFTYTILKAVFWSAIYLLILSFLVRRIDSIIEIPVAMKQFRLFQITETSIVVLLTTYIAISKMSKFIKSLFHERKKIHRQQETYF